MHEILQIYWWVLVSLIGAIFVFLTFVQGGQTLIFTLKLTAEEKDEILLSVGKKWELTFTTLVMFGGAMFAAFPLFYATSFGGAYWVWLLILFCFILQAVAYEYRKKPDNFLGQKTYEIFLLINGSLGIFLIGVAVSTFFSGSEFVLDEHNFVSWNGAWHGVEALLNPFNYSLGIALVFQSRVGASLYMINNITDEILHAKFRKALKFDSVLLVLFLVIFLITILLKSGFHVGDLGVISLIKFKYALNLIQIPFVGFMLIIGLVLALFGIFYGIFRKSYRGIFSYGFGVVLIVMSLFLIAGLNHTAFYPSTSNLQNSLTIANASSSFYTLKTMFFVSLGAPFVIAYIAYVWALMDKKSPLKESK